MRNSEHPGRGWPCPTVHDNDQDPNDPTAHHVPPGPAANRRRAGAAARDQAADPGGPEGPPHAGVRAGRGPSRVPGGHRVGVPNTGGVRRRDREVEVPPGPAPVRDRGMIEGHRDGPAGRSRSHGGGRRAGSRPMPEWERRTCRVGCERRSTGSPRRIAGLPLYSCCRARLTPTATRLSQPHAVS